MRAMRDQHESDEKKLLNDICEVDRLLEYNNISKHFLLKKSNTRYEQTQLNELFAGKRNNKSIILFFSKSLKLEVMMMMLLFFSYFIHWKTFLLSNNSFVLESFFSLL